MWSQGCAEGTRPTSTTTATNSLDGARVVIAHDFTEVYGGAERIAAQIAAIFPGAQFWSILGRADVARRMEIHGRARTLLPERELLLRRYRALTPLYPAYVATRALPECDLLITSSYAFAHGFRSRNDAPQLCYCYSPLRFAWSMTDGYAEQMRGGPVGAAALRGLAAGMRAMDRRVARRVTRYVAESHYVAAQVNDAFGRRADVIWPPVDCELFRPADVVQPEDYFLFSGRIIEPYKRAGLLVEAFRGLDRRLIIAGDGPDLSRLAAQAGPNVEFTGHLGDEELVSLMQRAAAVVFPSQDDFGLVPVEAMACGRPVLAYAGGGALETVIPGVTGEFFASQDVANLRAAITAFVPNRYDSVTIRQHAERWRPSRFRMEFLAAAAATVRG